MRHIVLLFTLLLFIATPALATPSFSVSAPQCTLGYHCAVKITKTGYASSYSDIAVSTSGAVAQPVTPTVRFQRGDTVKIVYAQSLSAGSFMATIKRVRYAVIGQGMTMGTVVDPNAVPVPPPPVPAPAPPPPAPAPAPAPPPAVSYMDGLQPLPSTPSHTCYDGNVLPNNQPCSAKPDYVGAFRFIMRDAGVNSDDAVVGVCGTSHLHQYYGRKGWNCSSTYASMRASIGLPGNDFNGFLAVNGSGYWTPAMLDANGNPAKLAFVAGYYKRRPASDPKCQGLGTVFGAEGKCVPLPDGLRQIAGYDMLTGKPASGNRWFNCQGPTATPGHYSNITEALANCPVGQGNLLGFVIELANCWNGKDVDSANHRDHVGYMTYDQNSGQPSCDSVHPFVIPQMTLGAWFNVVPGMHFSCDMGMVPGTCGHADYFENWIPEVKAMWEANCINKMFNCSGGDLGNGLQMKGAQ